MNCCITMAFAVLCAIHNFFMTSERKRKRKRNGSFNINFVKPRTLHQCGLLSHCWISLSLLCQCELSKGGLFSSLISRLWGDKEVRILILGLDNAGKTTILYRLQVCVAFFFLKLKQRRKLMLFFLVLWFRLVRW